jgi:hypothetical protein
MPFPCTCTTPEVHQRSAGRADRRLHAIDVENLLGGGPLTAARLRAWSDAYAGLGVFRCGDHVAIGVDVTGAAEVMLALRSPRVVLGRGRDGADRALLAVLRDELDPTRRYAELVLASGDGIFADEVARLRARGLAVTVVSRPQNLSRRLRIAAGTRAVWFPGARTTEGSSGEAA